jgi:hypothetical protein
LAVFVVRLIEPLLPPEERGLAGGIMWVVLTPDGEIGSPPPAVVRLLMFVKF